MVKTTAKVNNSNGIHARPSKDILLKANEFNCKIILKREKGQEYPANSIISVLSAAFLKDEIIEIIAEGLDEEKAAQEMAKLIESIQY